MNCWGTHGLTPEIGITPPVIEIAYLARHADFRGYGYGDFLLTTALGYCLGVSHIIGAIGVYLRSTREGRRLYTPFGFRNIGDNPERMFLPMQDVRALFPD